MSSTISDTQPMDVQRVVVTLDQPDLVIEPGSATRLVVTMTNRQDTPDRLLLEVEGIDIEWYNIPVPAVNVGPGVTVSERINFKMTRSSENRAGSYPFLVRIVAMETGEVGVAQAMLIVKPYDSLQVELNPKRATATFMRPLNDFEISIANEGNAERNLELFASDPDDDCVYEFDADHVVLKPGQTQAVLMAARPKGAAWLGSPRLYSFQVSARSSEDRYVTAKTQGQLERRALISPLAGLFLLLIGFGSAGYYFLRPVPAIPAKLESFEVTPLIAAEGSPVTLTWKVTGDKPAITLSHHIGQDSTEIVDGELTQRSGNEAVKPIGPQTTYTLTVNTLGNEGKGVSKSVTVNVNAKPAAPKPVLMELTADNTKVHVGEPVIISWKARNADSYIIDPGNYAVSGLSQTYTLNTQYTGDLEYTLRAVSADKRVTATKSIKISVVAKDVSIAEIADFGPTKGTVYIGDSVRLHWKTRRANSVRIENDRGDLTGAALPPNGAIDVTPSEPTTYTLIAADNTDKKSLPKQITIKPQPRPLPPPTPIPAPDTVKPDGNTPAPGTPGTPLPNPPNDGANPPAAAPGPKSP